LSRLWRNRLAAYAWLGERFPAAAPDERPELVEAERQQDAPRSERGDELDELDDERLIDGALGED